MLAASLLAGMTLAAAQRAPMPAARRRAGAAASLGETAAPESLV
jgi:hypothetical protein